jgi:hypothetical protein
MGGWSLYAHQGKLKYYYNFCGLLHFEATASSPVPSGKHETRMEFAYDGGGIGKGANVTLYVDGKQVGEGRLARTTALFFSMDETLEVGCDVGEPVSPDYGRVDNEFNGTVNWVQFDVDSQGRGSYDWRGEERFRLVMARQ